MDTKKNTILLTVIAVATLLVALVGATFAYFTAQGGAAVDANINVATGSAASADFGTINDMMIYADATTFAKGAGNREGTSTGTVKWTAPGKITDSEGNETIPEEHERTFCYTVTIKVNTNTFAYTTEDNKAELLLNITKDANEITTGISGLTYTSVVDGKGVTLNGWDITTGNPTIEIPGDSGNIHKIVADAGAEKTNSWQTKVTLVNLDADQNGNTNKNFAAVLSFNKVNCQ